MNIITQAGTYENSPGTWIRTLKAEIDPVSSQGDYCPRLARFLREAGILTSIRFPDQEGGQWFSLKFDAEDRPYIDLTDGWAKLTFEEAQTLGMKAQKNVTEALTNACMLSRMILALDKSGQIANLNDARTKLAGLNEEVAELRSLPRQMEALEQASKLQMERIANLDRLVLPTARGEIEPRFEEVSQRISTLGRRCGKVEQQMEKLPVIEERLQLLVTELQKLDSHLADISTLVPGLTSRVETLEIKLNPPQEVLPPKPKRSRKPRAA